MLARSEEGTNDGRGLSMFIYDNREHKATRINEPCARERGPTTASSSDRAERPSKDAGVHVRRIENKLGIHGSPTCELVYKNAKAELCGRRKFGLIKYVMALMNGARLGFAA